MIRIGIYFILIFSVHLYANDNLITTDADELARINQKVAEVFKGTEFDSQQTTIDNQNMHSINSANIQEHSTNLATPIFELESPNTIKQTIDSFMMKELLDSCSQTLLNDIHNTAYIASQPKLRYDTIYANQMTRLLLVGPRGSGKSSLALAIAHTLNRPYIFASAAALVNEYKNSAVSIINNLFDPLIESGIQAVVIIDEITAFTKRFNSKNADSDPGAVEHLWIKLDSCKNNPALLVIFTANSTDEIPDTIKDRLSASEFFINHPDFYARKRIIDNYLSPYFNFDKSFLDEISEKTEGFTLREINMVIFRAQNNALHRNIRKDNTSPIELKKNDIESALKTLLTAHKAELGKKNKQYYREIYEAIAPHIVPVVSMLINIYLQVKFHEQQMAFNKQCYEETKTFQKQAHDEIVELNQWNADRQHYEAKKATEKNMKFQNKAHQENMEHQRRAHWDNMAHAIETADRQQEFTIKSNEDVKQVQKVITDENKEIGEKHHKESIEISERHQKENLNQSAYNSVGNTIATVGTTVGLATCVTCPPLGGAIIAGSVVVGAATSTPSVTVRAINKIKEATFGEIIKSYVQFSLFPAYGLHELAKSCMK